MSHSVKPLGLHQAFKCHVPKLHAWSLFQNSWAQAEVLQCAPSGPQGEVNMPSADPAVAVVGEKAGSTYIYIYFYINPNDQDRIYTNKRNGVAWGHCMIVPKTHPFTNSCGQPVAELDKYMESLSTKVRSIDTLVAQIKENVPSSSQSDV